MKHLVMGPWLKRQPSQELPPFFEGPPGAYGCLDLSDKPQQGNTEPGISADHRGAGLWMCDCELSELADFEVLTSGNDSWEEALLDARQLSLFRQYFNVPEMPSFPSLVDCCKYCFLEGSTPDESGTCPLWPSLDENGSRVLMVSFGQHLFKSDFGRGHAHASLWLASARQQVAAANENAAKYLGWLLQEVAKNTGRGSLTWQQMAFGGGPLPAVNWESLVPPEMSGLIPEEPATTHADSCTSLAAWTSLTGNHWVLYGPFAGNYGISKVGGSHGYIKYNSPVSGSDNYTQAYQHTLNVADLGPICRLTDLNNFYRGGNGVNTWEDSIWKRVSGTITRLGSVSINDHGATIKIQAVGSSITQYKNGIVHEAVTDSSLASGLYGGYYHGSEYSQGCFNTFVFSDADPPVSAGPGVLRRRRAPDGFQRMSW